MYIFLKKKKSCISLGKSLKENPYITDDIFMVNLDYMRIPAYAL